MLAGGWCYVREIVMPTYAKAFAAVGINAMIFDYRNLGVSDGDNRQHLDPWAQIRDYQNAISFLERRDDVDPHRITGEKEDGFERGFELRTVTLRARCLLDVEPLTPGLFQGVDL